MATGDVKGNLRSLQTALNHAKYPKDLDFTSLARGSAREFLPIMHYMLCDYSRPVTHLILESNLELVAKTDQKFMEAVYKLLRDLFHYVPRITGPQFFKSGFAEHKILLTRDLVSMVRNKHKQLTRASNNSECALTQDKVTSKMGISKRESTGCSSSNDSEKNDSEK